MIAKLFLLAALLGGTPATATAAQDSAPHVQTASGDQVAVARAEADRIIEAASAGDLFVNITGNALPRVRHTASGLICTFQGGSEVNRITIFPGGERGSDVGCTTGDDRIGAELTVYATRYDPLPSEEVILEHAKAAIRNRFPSARPFEGALTSMQSDEVSPISAAFVIETTIGEMFTMATVEHADGWSFKARATGPVEKASEVNMMEMVNFTMMLNLRTVEPFASPGE